MDKKLAEIVSEAIKEPNPKCPKCNIEGVIKGWGEVAWCECPVCRAKIGEAVIM